MLSFVSKYEIMISLNLQIEFLNAGHEERYIKDLVERHMPSIVDRVMRVMNVFGFSIWSLSLLRLLVIVLVHIFMYVFSSEFDIISCTLSSQQLLQYKILSITNFIT